MKKLFLLYFLFALVNANINAVEKSPITKETAWSIVKQQILQGDTSYVNVFICPEIKTLQLGMKVCTL